MPLNMVNAAQATAVSIDIIPHPADSSISVETKARIATETSSRALKGPSARVEIYSNRDVGGSIYNRNMLFGRDWGRLEF